MQPGDPALYLDPILPLWVRAQPRSIPRAVGSTAAAALLLCECGAYRLRPANDPAGGDPAAGNPTAPSGRQLVPPAIEAPGLFTTTTACATLLHVAPETRGWVVVMGRRLLDELAVAAFGEPGFCRFVDGLAHAGATPAGAFGPELSQLADALIAELDERPPAYRVRARSLLTDLLLTVYRSAITAVDPALTDGHHLASVIDFIETHYAEQLSLEELAAMMGTSPTHFSRVFRREIGVPLFEFINRTRVRRACALLRRTNLPVTRIAVDVGYNNVSFFNRYFRRVMRLSPREYRRFVTR